MTIYYFLTLDKSTTNSYSSKHFYYKVLAELRRISLFQNTGIKCYELKHKSKKYPYWLHFHCIIKTERIIDFRTFQSKGCSVNLKLLRSTLDIVRTAVYINKLKIDQSDLNKAAKLDWLLKEVEEFNSE